MVEKLKNKFYFFIIVFCSLCLFISPSILHAKKATKAVASKKSQKAKKAETAKTANGQSTRKYVIKKGDTLAKIATANGCDLETIRKLNPGLNPRRIKTSTVIKLPLSTVAKNTKEIKKDNKVLIYRVKKGDTLYSIAKRYNLSEDELKQLNKINDEHIVAGMKLLIKSLSAKDDKVETKKTYSLTDVDEDDFGEDIDGETTTLTLSDSDKGETKANYIVPPYTLSKEKLEKMLSYSLDFLGTDYKYGGNTVSAIDCSAFVKTVFKEVNINLPRTSREQFTLGVDVALEELKEGDLLFFAKKKRISHVGIYIGNDMFVHAARRGKGVIVTKLDSPYVKKHFVGAKRLFTVEGETYNIDSKKDLSLVEKPLIN
ncbi:MAG: C40 family peptidase [bacterium]